MITGIVASFVGGGAEILNAPLLIYMNVFDDYKTAVGTSLASLLLPTIGGYIPHTPLAPPIAIGIGYVVGDTSPIPPAPRNTEGLGGEPV